MSTPERGAEAIVAAGLGRRPERYVPRYDAVAAAARVLAPRLVRRIAAGGLVAVVPAGPGADAAEGR